MPFQLSPPGVPGCAMVWTRHATRPVSASRPTISGPPGLAPTPVPTVPIITLPFATSGPPPICSRTFGSPMVCSHTSAAGLRVERDHVHVRRAHVEPVAVQREAALEAAGDALGQAAVVLPQQVAGAGVERLHAVVRALHEHHAVVHQRRRLGGSGRQRPAPRDAQPRDVARRDLRERAEALRVVAAPPGEPVLRRGLDELGIGDGRERIERVRPLHGGQRRRVGRVGRHAEAADGNDHARQRAPDPTAARSCRRRWRWPGADTP